MIGHVHELAHDAADVVLRQVPDEHADRVFAIERVRVGEHEHVPVEPENRAVERGALAFPALERLEHDAAALVLPHDIVGSVDGAVARDHDLEPVFRVIQREAVINLVADDALFVVHGDDQDHPRDIPVVAPDPVGAKEPEEVEDERVPDIRIQHDTENGYNYNPCSKFHASPSERRY